MEGIEQYAAEDLGNIISFEHVNVTVPDQTLATLFYIVGMGFTRDPYVSVGVDNMWINVGSQQFHAPTRSPQVLRGHIGIVVPDLAALQQRLEAVQGRLAGTKFAWVVDDGRVDVTCPWGNRLRCHSPDPRFGDVRLGIPYVEFTVPQGAAPGIERFYRGVFGATACLVQNAQGPAARVEVGKDQWFVFQETQDAVPSYDGHHVAVYVANLSGPYAALAERDLVTEGLRNHQFRFQNIVDPEDGRLQFQIEHEVRSLRHPQFKRPLINRLFSQDAANRGPDRAMM